MSNARVLLAIQGCLVSGLVCELQPVPLTSKLVQSSLVKCTSKNDNMDLIIRKICSFEETLGIKAWIERVPSQSNVSDGLSRKVTKAHNGIDCTPIGLSNSKVGEKREAEPNTLCPPGQKLLSCDRTNASLENQSQRRIDIEAVRIKLTKQK